jgi:hypothetical protein
MNQRRPKKIDDGPRSSVSRDRRPFAKSPMGQGLHPLKIGLCSFPSPKSRQRLGLGGFEIFSRQHDRGPVRHATAFRLSFRYESRFVHVRHRRLDL